MIKKDITSFNKLADYIRAMSENGADKMDLSPQIMQTVRRASNDPRHRLHTNLVVSGGFNNEFSVRHKDMRTSVTVRAASA